VSQANQRCKMAGTRWSTVSSVKQFRLEKPVIEATPSCLPIKHRSHLTLRWTNNLPTLALVC